MNLNIVKLYKRINYIYDLIRYLILRLLSFCKCIFKKNSIDVFHSKADKATSQVVFLGEADREYFTCEYNIKHINQEFGNPETIVFLENKNSDSDSDVKFNVPDTNVVGLTEDYQLIKMSECVVGCTVFNLKNYRNLKQLQKEILIKRRTLIKNGADFLVAYVKYESGISYDLSKAKKIIGRWGFDIVVGVDRRIKNKRSYRTVSLGETRILYSLGRIYSEVKFKEEFGFKHSIAYKVELKKEKNKYKIKKEGYLPLIVNYKNNHIENVCYLDKKSCFDNKEKYKHYLYLEKVMSGSQPWSDMILLSDVFDVLEIDKPEKYDYLMDSSINQICARTFELAPGNIFFYRQQFNDNNDKKLENEFFRLRLVLRAYIRRSLFVFSYRPLPRFIPHVVIDNPMEAHIKLMAWYKQKFIHVKTIGVTGSIGKTSTKDIIYYTLRKGFNAQRNIRNTNVQVKIGINLQRIPSDCEVFIQEIGGGRPGGASRHSRMVLPDITVVTNIGTAHIGNFDSQTELMNNKLGIIDGMPPNGIIYLNGDDELLKDAHPDCNTVYYAVHNKEADYYVENIIEKDETTEFDVVHEGKHTKLKINVIGEHNILNAVCAFAIASHLGMDTEDICKGMQDFKTSGVRQNIIKTNRCTLFMDCYNASLESVKTSLDTLEGISLKENGHRFAVIGDITGTGEMQEEVNQKVAETISEHNIDKIVLYGKNAESISGYLKSNKNNVICITKRNDLEKWIASNVSKRDTVLFKGSSKVKLDEIVDSVFGFNTCDQRYIDEAEYIRFAKNEMHFRIFEDYASLAKYTGKKEYINIGNKVAWKKIAKIWKGAFSNNKHVRFIKIGKNIKHVGSESFLNCQNLEEVVIGKNVKFIGAGAFSGCDNLKKITFCSEVDFIGKKAFSGCNSLQEIVLNKENYERMMPKLKSIKANIVIR